MEVKGKIGKTNKFREIELSIKLTSEEEFIEFYGIFNHALISDATPYIDDTSIREVLRKSQEEEVTRKLTVKSSNEILKRISNKFKSH